MNHSFHTSSPQATDKRRLRFCPICGAPFPDQPLKPFARQHCNACGYTHHLNPAPGTAVLVHAPDGRILIGKRTQDARYGGRWCLPGGYVEYEESYLATAHREIREETGLDIELQGIASVISNQLDDCHHTLVIVFIGVVCGGEQTPGDDLVELRWINQEEHVHLDYAFRADAEIIDSFFRGNLHILPVQDNQSVSKPESLKKSAEPGYMHVYTGNGKGKTTAALGLSLRAAAAGKKIFIGQFIKGMHYSELDLLPRLPGITLKQYGRRCFINGPPAPEDYAAAQAGLAEMAAILREGAYDMVILDEANIALYFKLLDFAELQKALLARAPHVEVVLTGRGAPQELIDMADLVTEMREIKHYYTKGVEARTGIEK